MLVVIDRFEEEYALCEKEDGGIIQIPKNKIPHGTKEGAVLRIDEDKIVLDKTETMKKKKEIDKLINDLWKE
ncbi:DUF3006 domain-containing protein [Clostridiaceae bacterium 35-E11]